MPDAPAFLNQGPWRPSNLRGISSSYTMDANVKNQFLAAYDSYAEAIYRHCFFRVFSAAKAEDIMQESFMRVWEYLADGKEVQNIRAFVYRVANNLIIDDSRKKKEESLENMLEINPAADPAYEGHKDMEKNVVVQEIHRAMARLPEDVKEILVYRYVDDLDPKEIADILKITPNNVSVRLNRAIKVLKKELEKQEQ